MTDYLSWGRLPHQQQTIKPLQWRTEPLPQLGFDQSSYLGYGLGRSYGDSCLNSKGLLLSSKGLQRYIAFDAQTGIIEVEAGVTLAAIAAFALPRGWFLPVTPGTQYVTYGGAVANDVHGKNHHTAGTFGCHVPSFYLHRSNGQHVRCTPHENIALFRATIGGLGLTGLITHGQLQLKKVASTWLNVTQYRYRNFDEFCELSSKSAAKYEYTVAWVDSQATGRKLGQGLFLAANHCDHTHDQHSAPQPGGLRPARKISIPFTCPNITLNPWSIAAFNTLYLNRQQQYQKQFRQKFQSFFYPLDQINHWHKIYGSRGFYQYQCVIPKAAKKSLQTIINLVAQSHSGSFLTVLKEFGARQSPGIMSFPMPGYTFALDFPNQGDVTQRLLNALDEVTIDAGGKVYPAKDARMSAQAFQAFYPQVSSFAPLVDPAFSSDFWRRVHQYST